MGISGAQLSENCCSYQIKPDINPSGRQKQFTTFVRLHDHVEGPGIGLYMVKKIVENAGGRIEVESEMGVGSTFSVYLKVDEQV